MSLEKNAEALLKKALWTTTLTEDQLAAARLIALPVSQGVRDPDKVYNLYHARAQVIPKHRPMQKRKVVDLYKVLILSENRPILNHLVATS